VCPRSTPSGVGHKHAHTQVGAGRVHAQPQGGLDVSMPGLGYVHVPPDARAQLSATWRQGTLQCEGQTLTPLGAMVCYKYYYFYYNL